MRNVPDKRVSSTARFDHPEENSITVRRDVSDLSDIAALQETEKKIAPEKSDRKAYQRESTYDLGLLNDFKPERDFVTEYLHNILLEVNLYDRISEVTPEIYQRINHLISSENLSPSGVSEVLKQEYDGIKIELSTRHKNGSLEQEYQFEEKLDQKISADKLYVESLKQGAYQKTAFDTIDRLANKYGQGVTLSPETLTDAMIAVEDTVNKLAPGIGREGAITKIKETRGLLFSNALQGYGDQKNYNAIQSLLDGIDPVTNARLNSGDYITAEERNYFQNLASKGLRREAAYQLLDDVEAQVISTDELLDALQNHPNNSLGQEALSLWHDRKRTKKKVNRDRIKKLRYTVWDNITETNGNIDITDLPLDLSDEDRDLFFSYLANQENLNTGGDDLKGQGAKVPDVLLYEIKKLQIANPDIFADRDLSGYFKNLSPKQIAQVIAMQENGLDPKDVASFKMREREALRIWKQVMGRNGYDELDRQDFINFSIRFGEQIDDFITFEERSASAGDIKQIANSMIENGEVIPASREIAETDYLKDFEQDTVNTSEEGNIPVSGELVSGDVNNQVVGKSINISVAQEEFEKNAKQELVIPEDLRVAIIEDEQTALDSVEKGIPSYKVVLVDVENNVFYGPITTKTWLPGEPNLKRYLRFIPSVGLVDDDFKTRRIVPGSHISEKVDVLGRRTRSITNIDGVGDVNTEYQPMKLRLPYVADTDTIQRYESTIGKIRDALVTSDNKKPTKEDISNIIIDNHLRKLWEEMVGDRKSDEYGEKGYILFHQTIIKHLDEKLLQFSREPVYLADQLEKLVRNLGEKGIVPSITSPEKYGDFFLGYPPEEKFFTKFGIKRVQGDEPRPSVSTTEQGIQNYHILKSMSSDELDLIDSVLKDNDFHVVNETRVFLYKRFQEEREAINNEIIKINKHNDDLSELKRGGLRAQKKQGINNTISENNKRLRVLNRLQANSTELYDYLLSKSEIEKELEKRGEQSLRVQNGAMQRLFNSAVEGVEEHEKNEIGFQLAVGWGNKQELVRELDDINENNFAPQYPHDMTGKIARVTKGVGNAIKPFIYKAGGGSLGAITAGSVAFAAGQAGPQIAIPEEIITVPVAALNGAVRGVEFADFVDTYIQQTGAIYTSIRKVSMESGLQFDHKTASRLSMGMGLVSTIANDTLGKFGNKLGKAMANAMKDKKIANRLIQFSNKYLADILAEGGMEAVSEAFKITSELLYADLSSQNKKIGDSSEYMKRVVESTLDKMEEYFGKAAVKSLH